MAKKVDFLPEDYLIRKGKRRTNMVCLFMFVLVVASVGSGLFYVKNREKVVQAQMDKVKNEMAQASQAMTQLEQLEKKKKDMMTKASISAMLMEPIPRSFLMATVTNDLPAGVSLVDFEMESKEIKAAAPIKKASKKKKVVSSKDSKTPEIKMPPKLDTRIEFTGLSPSDIEVAKLIANLNKTSIFKQVNLILSEEHKINEEMVRRFKLLVVLDPEARVSQQDLELARTDHISGM